MNFQDQLRDASRLLRELRSSLEAEHAGPTSSGTARDPQMARWLSGLDLDKPIQLRWGRVVDAIPHANAYRISAGPQSFLWCSDLSHASFLPFGVRTSSSIAPGNYVYYLQHPESFTGHIVGVMPVPILGDGPFRADAVFPGSRAGLKVEPCHRVSLKQILSGGAVNWSAGRPVDATTLGEWGLFTETGLRLFLDSFMAQLAVDEETGLYLFYHDQLCRLAGKNLQVRSATGEREDLDDEGELYRVDGSSPYFWERLGASSYPAALAPYRTFTADQVQNKDLQGRPECAEREPAYDDQQAFHRLVSYGGYLGQGGKRQVLFPPADAPDLYRFSQTDLALGAAFEESVALTGAWHVRTAKRVLIAKRPCIPAPKQIRRPEDQSGDGAANYRASGLSATQFAVSGTTPHIVRGEVATTASPANRGHLVRAAALLDLAAYAFNWESSHPFFYHQRDWYFPEEGDGDLPVDHNSETIDFAGLSSAQYLLPPTPVDVGVDHRYPTAKVWPNDSYFALLDDGGVVLSDGYGAELRMTGGSIFLSCPGDLWLQPGKNLNTWAGRDVILNANNSAELVANLRDVRVKANHNVMVLGGNDRCGGVVVESKASCPAYDYTGNIGEDVVTTGVVLRADKSQVVLLGKDAVIRTGYPDADPGDVVIDAGENRVKVRADYVERFIAQSAIDYFTDQEVNEWSATRNSVSGPLRVGGALQVDSCAWIHGWLSVTSGHIMTKEATTYRYLTAQLTTAAEDQAEGLRDDATARDDDLRDNIRPDEETRLEFDAELSEDTEFSFRTTAQYRTTGMVLFEARWHQLARLGSGIPAAWSMNYVTTRGGTQTYPHPGKEVWTGLPSTSWYKQNLSLYDVAEGTSLPRGDTPAHQAAYENPVFAGVSDSPLEGYYPVIDND